jgi:hypothetical protein
MDNEHVVIWLLDTCIPQNVQKSKTVQELVVVGSDGVTQHLRNVDMTKLSPGPDNTILVTHDASVDVLGPDLRVLKSIQGTHSSSESSNNGPAGCTTASPANYRDIAIWMHSGSRNAWCLDGRVLWYFDQHGTLTTIDANHVSTPVLSKQWVPKDSNCTGEVSTDKPQRFLASCVGAHFFSDGELDAIFGYSRIALFDVASKRILLRIDGPAFTSATVSPDGRKIATIHRGRKITLRLYDVN